MAKLSFAGLDTFEKEPTPAVKVLMSHKVSLSPHIGAATNEAQDRIGTELASQIITFTQINSYTKLIKYSQLASFF